MVVKPKINNAVGVVKALGEALGQQTQITNKVCEIVVPKSNGSGFVRAFEFPMGLSLLMVDIHLRDSITINITDASIKPLLFVFNIKGDFIHHLDNNHIQYRLPIESSSIVSNVKGRSQFIYLNGGGQHRFIIAMIDRYRYLGKIESTLENLPEILVSTFKDIESRVSFFYMNAYNISCTECIKKIYNKRIPGLVNYTYSEAKTLELVACLIDQYCEEVEGRNLVLNYKPSDLEAIKKAKQYIQDNLSVTTTIPELAKIVGLNQQKLKKGFKDLYQKTIRQFLREERLERASVLILRNEMNIGAVAEEVGYQNKSHFAKRFKERYGVLPKDFLSSSRDKWQKNAETHEQSHVL